jgi:predicted esterase
MWQGGFPNELDLADAAWLRAVNLTIVASPDDPYIPPANVDAVLAQLDAHGIAYERHSFDGGHRMDAETLGRIAGGR